MIFKFFLFIFIFLELFLISCAENRINYGAITSDPAIKFLKNEKNIKQIWERGQKVYLILFDTIQLSARIKKDSITLSLNFYSYQNNDTTKLIVSRKIEEKKNILLQILQFMERNKITNLVLRETRIEFTFSNNKTLIWDGNDRYSTTLFYSPEIFSYKYTFIERNWVLIETENK